ncbi:MAG TPA: hypothetical protein ENO07_05890 [candidate division Zixibacteria bacterium]|nr:hypothetical protein [candidate division Zixibacteria bacterium]
MVKLKLTVLLFLFSAAAAHGAPIAPKAEPPGKTSDPEVQMQLQSLQDDRIPDERELGIPAYPGARTANVTENSINGLNWIIILSEDPPEKVKEFYENSLSAEWDHWEKFGIFYFSTADRNAAEQHEEPVMEIFKPFGSQAVLMPSAQTIMNIFYR